MTVRIIEDGYEKHVFGQVDKIREVFNDLNTTEVQLLFFNGRYRTIKLNNSAYLEAFPIDFKGE